jgi:hypothetical protein
MKAKQREELDWLAFRYVAAELSPAESRDFEGRLERDQEAREAVGRIVEITCAVRSLDWDTAPSVARVRRLRPWYQRRGVQAVAGLALGLTVALVVWGLRSGEPRRAREGNVASVPPAAELADVWIHARTELSAPPVDEAAGWPWSAPTDEETDLTGPIADGVAADTPDWMVSAVVAMESPDEDQRAPASNVEGI